jgi:hypothetical protein
MTAAGLLFLFAVVIGGFFVLPLIELRHLTRLRRKDLHE